NRRPSASARVAPRHSDGAVCHLAVRQVRARGLSWRSAAEMGHRTAATERCRTQRRMIRRYSMKKFVLALATAAQCMLVPAYAQEFPKKSITLIVGFAAGGAADTAARIIARKLSDNLGVSVVVDNRAGAGGNIAHQVVAHAEPDGATILLGSI